MKTPNALRSPLALLLSGLLFLSPQGAQALTCREGPETPVPVPAGASAVAASAAAAKERAAEKLATAGLPADEAAAHVETMAPEEIAYLADQAPEVKSGGDAGSTVLLLIAVAAIVYIVFDYVYYHQAPAY